MCTKVWAECGLPRAGRTLQDTPVPAHQTIHNLLVTRDSKTVLACRLAGQRKIMNLDLILLLNFRFCKYDLSLYCFLCVLKAEIFLITHIFFGYCVLYKQMTIPSGLS